jgi:hypothetical protein
MEAKYDSRIFARNQVPTMESVLDAFENAIKAVPKPRDSRSEPIIEPHYKLLSIVHKLVTTGPQELDGLRSKDFGFQEAADLLQRQPYALRKGESVIVTDIGMWRQFILESLRHLRNSDKSNWQHRMIYRAARILCPDPVPDEVQAKAARNELKETMFTKTMVVQVWKPEYERPGRHCVYTERYVRFMIQLLVLLDDKPNMEALVKRVRKKAADYFHFSEVWSECCSLYLRLLRRSGNITPNQDDIVKSIPQDEFAPVADVLDKWCNDPESSSLALDCLRDAMELKRLNQNLMKIQPIDDLISDAYATLYLRVGVTLPRPPPPPVQSPPPLDGATRLQGPMSLNNLVSNMDGVVDAMQIQFAPQQTLDAVRPRNKGVSRREMIRRAEAAVTRVPDQSKPYSGSNPRAGEQSAMDNFVSRGMGVDSAPEARGLAALREEDAKDTEDQSSAPGSVHDSADDESDLSDVPEDLDDEPEIAPLFPNLARSVGEEVAASEGEGGSGGSSGDKEA